MVPEMSPESVEPIPCERCGEAVADLLVLAVEVERARAGEAPARWRPVCDTCWPADVAEVWKFAPVRTSAWGRRNTLEHVRRKTWARDLTDLDGLAQLLGPSAPRPT